MSGDMIERIQSASEKDFVKSGLEHSFERSAKVLRTDKMASIDRICVLRHR